MALSYPASAQQPPKIPRIGFLASSSGERLKGRINGFEQGLRELGYEQSKTLTIEYVSAEGRFDRLPELAQRLLKSPIDVLVAEGAPLAADRVNNSFQCSR